MKPPENASGPSRAPAPVPEDPSDAPPLKGRAAAFAGLLRKKKKGNAAAGQLLFGAEDSGKAPRRARERGGGFPGGDGLGDSPDRERDRTTAVRGTPPQLRPGLHQPLELNTTAEVESVRPAAEPAQIDQLVREIAVVTQDGIPQVNVVIDSRTLEGLHIRVASDQGRLSVEFQTNSEDVQRLLERNLESLTKGLSARKLRVAGIRVTAGAARPVDRRGAPGGAVS